MWWGEERALLRRRVNDGRIASSEYLKCSAVMPKASIAFPVFRDLTARVVKEVVRSGGGVWEHSWSMSQVACSKKYLSLRCSNSAPSKYKMSWRESGLQSVSKYSAQAIQDSEGSLRTESPEVIGETWDLAWCCFLMREWKRRASPACADDSSS